MKQVEIGDIVLYQNRSNTCSYLQNEQLRMINIKTFRLSEQSLSSTIKEKYQLKSNTAAIEYALTATISADNLSQKLDTVEHELFLLKKYTNELRRNNHILLSLVDAISFKLDIQNVPVRDDKRFRTPAYLDTYAKMQAYLDAVMAKNKDMVTDNEVLDE